jgi:hypothetical protein
VSSAGQKLVTGRVPGEELGLTTETSDGASSAAETVGITVTAPVVVGRKYKVVVDTAMEGGSVDDRVVCRIREDDANGTVKATRNRVIAHVSGTAGNPVHMECRYTADATENKSFVFTYDSASANAVNMAASTTFPTFMYVEYVSG